MGRKNKRNRIENRRDDDDEDAVAPPRRQAAAAAQAYHHHHPHHQSQYAGWSRAYGAREPSLSPYPAYPTTPSYGGPSWLNPLPAPRLSTTSYGSHAPSLHPAYSPFDRRRAMEPPGTARRLKPDDGTEDEASSARGYIDRASAALADVTRLPAQPLYMDLDSTKERAERAARKAHDELLAARTGVTVWKVSQAVLQALNADSFESLGFQLSDIPSMRKLMSLEGKVNAYIHCHVAVRRITTLHELGLEISANEGVKDFDALGLGPLSVQPVAIRYFSPPTGFEICKLTTEDILQYLGDFLNKHQQSKVQLEDFLDFMVKALSLASRQHLCARIQSFGMYVQFIRREKKAEQAIASHRANLAAAKESIAQQPQELSITKRVDSFLTLAKKSANASDDEYMEEDLPNSKGDGGQGSVAHNSCPYPSAAEERIRLLSKLRADLGGEFLESGYAMSKQALGDFISTWKGACQNLSVSEVLAHMLWSLGESRNSSKRKRKLAKLFRQYPAVGILNVAVLSMKAGHWNSLYDAFEEAVNRDIKKLNESVAVEAADRIDIPAKVVEQPMAEVPDSTDVRVKQMPSSETVLKELIHIFGVICNELCSSLSLSDAENFLLPMRQMVKAEKKVVDHFHLKDFPSLKLGDFYDFVQQHWDKLSTDILRICNSRARMEQGEICVPQERIQNFLSQVILATGDGKGLSKTFALQLLCRQFHIQNLGEWSSRLVEKCIKSASSDNISNSQIFFSSALLAGKEGWLQASEAARMWHSDNKNDNDPQGLCKVGLLGSMSSSDAKHCLLKAPMFCDLERWLQWNSIFLPTLGPFLDWLEREGPIAGLACLATCEGAVLRIDGSATVDSFLTAIVEGSGKHAAFELVSLLAVYGGADRLPLSLLRSHVSQGIDIIVGKCDVTIGKVKRKLSSVCETEQVVKKARLSAFENTCTPSNLKEGENLSEGNISHKYEKAVQFSFDLINSVPSEFVIFTASVVLQPFLGIVANGLAALLGLCVTAEHRMRLHAIGLALGLAEWIKDYQTLYLASSRERLCDDTNMLKPGNTSSTNFLSGPVSDQDSGNAGEHVSPASGMELASDLDIQHSNSKHSGGHLHSGFLDVRDQGELEKEAKELIDFIRKEEFGMDMNLEGKELKLVAKQHARIGRALQCLSQELYSQDSHFVLELVQNADDNQYAPGVDGTLVFILQTDRVVVVNNELGFTSANMRALCDVGNSTKAGSAAGYIGHKGIGFKSVFRVTNAPEIHSKGFHVKFDVSQGNIGFILPTVIPPVSDWHTIQGVLSLTEKLTGGEKQTWSTCMILPLKSSVSSGPDIEILSSKFSDIQPSLLLFLHHLRSIAIKDELKDSIRVMQRSDLANGLVRVIDGDNCAVWLVVKEEYKAVIERRGVEKTELALAFPLHEVSDGVYEGCYEPQQVFSFLPLRSYGFRLIIQGDFILPSSREELDTDSAWNQWLLSEIPNVWVKAVDHFKELPCFKGNPGKGAAVLMKFVPLEGEVQGFLGALPRMIIGSLRGINCLPIEGSSSEWVLPCMLLGGWDEFCRKLLPDNLLQEFMGLYYLHRDTNIHPSLASSLGVHMYGSQVLISFMESICKKKQKLELLGPRWIGAWLVALQKCLMRESNQSLSFSAPKTEIKQLRTLKTLAFIPLSDGTYTSLEDGPVWLPCVDMSEADSFVEHFPLLYSELRTVHALLLDPINMDSEDGPSIKSENRSLVCSMLHRLGIGQVLEHDVLMTHILPGMLSKSFCEKPKLIAVQYLAFAMDHLQSTCKQCRMERSSVMTQLQRNALVVTNDGYKKVGCESLHFGPEFGSTINAKKIISGLQVAWLEVDPAYLQAIQGWSEEVAILKWRSFFKELGVTDFVKLEHVVKTFPDKSKSIWKDMPLEGCDEGELVFHDWECTELVTILEGLCNANLDLSERVIRSSHLLSAFDQLWETCYSEHRTTYCNSRTATVLEKKTVPSFILQMRRFAWVPSSIDGNLHYPTELFHQCSTVESILGVHAPYAVPKIYCSKLAEALGLRTIVSAQDVLELIRCWNQQSFETSVNQMGRIYTYLLNATTRCKEQIVQFFQTQAAIFIPATMNTNSDTPVLGNFFAVQNLFWRDETGAVFLLKCSELPSNGSKSDNFCWRPLNSVYPTLHSFFVETLHVQNTIHYKDYFQVLKSLAMTYSPHDILEQVLSIYCKLSLAIDMGSVASADLSFWKEFLQNAENRVLPTVQNKWVSLHPSGCVICWCDDERLGRQFIDCSNVYYVCVKSGTATTDRSKINTGRVDSFLQAMGIPPLSKVVEREPIYYGAQNSKQLFDLLNWTLPYVQRYLQKWHFNTYKDLQTSFNERLGKFRCVLIDQLYFRYKVCGQFGSSSQRIQTDFLLQGDTFYASQMENLNSLFLEFSRLFFNGTTNLQLANFLHLITLSVQSGSQQAELEALLSSQGIDRFPQEAENQWSFNSKEVVDTVPAEPVPVLDPGKRHYGKFFTDNVWPPRSWTHATKKSSASQIERYAACEKSLASVLKEIEKKQKRRLSKDTRDAVLESDACKSGSSNGINNPTTEGNRESMFQQAFAATAMNYTKGGVISREGLLEAFNFGFPESGTTDHTSFPDRTQLSIGRPDEQYQEITGRLGEAVVFDYLLERHGPGSVAWINASEESGLPYDIELRGPDGESKLIEVKSTWSENKDWFEISNREWELALQAGDRYIIVRVFLIGPQGEARFLWLPNPIRLCQERIMKLALILPQSHPAGPSLPPR